MDDPFHDWDLNETLNALTDIPLLEDLELHEVCSYANLADLTWTCPLRRLTIMAFKRDSSLPGATDEDDIEDLSLALQGLPRQLQHLMLGSHIYFPELSAPFPPHLLN